MTTAIAKKKGATPKEKSESARQQLASWIGKERFEKLGNQIDSPELLGDVLKLAESRVRSQGVGPAASGFIVACGSRLTDADKAKLAKSND